MCQVVIRVADKINPDKALNQQLLKRGDIVELVGDDHVWSAKELTNPDWRIVVLPALTESDVLPFMAPEFPTGPETDVRILRRRAFSFDIEALPAQWAAWFADDTRAQPTRTLNATAGQISAYKKKKAALDPSEYPPP